MEKEKEELTIGKCNAPLRRPPYDASQPMRSVISDNSLLLMTLVRFGISLGFGDKSVKEVCDQQGIDCNTFLTVINYLSGRDYSIENIDMEQLMEYFKQAHNYFLDFQIPMIRRTLIEAIDIASVDSIGFLIIKFYDDFATEVRTHMEVENDHVFPYVESLLDRSDSRNYSIESYRRGHTAIAPKLQELKDLIVRYYPGKGNDLLTSALYDIITCEQDLNFHCRAEDDLFIPAVRQLEQRIEKEDAENDNRFPAANASRSNQSGEKEISSATDAEKLASLSDREKEIICLIARGLLNKEIAAKLFLSVHTVATHRRNISAKLGIHSPSGLTIFAIVNGLLDISEIPRSGIS